MTHDFAIAFELLKPVLEKANAKQLENIENYSPVCIFGNCNFFKTNLCLLNFFVSIC